jgi:hypothetical protein
MAFAVTTRMPRTCLDGIPTRIGNSPIGRNLTGYAGEMQGEKIQEHTQHGLPSPYASSPFSTPACAIALF